MRVINGLRVESTAVQVEGNNYRPGLVVFGADGAETALFDVGYAGTVDMPENIAHDAARAILDDVVRVSEDGRAVFVADGAIRVRLIR